MNYPTDSTVVAPGVSGDVLVHNLARFFPELRRFSSTKELERSELYRQIKPAVEEVLAGVAQGSFVSGISVPGQAAAIRATAWNIERGIQLDRIIATLRDHPLLSPSDVFFLTELDYGMARSGNRLVAREIASAMGLNYTFAPCYINLNKGSGLESETQGENSLALHGNALFARYPLLQAHSIALPNGKDKMRGKEKRLGCQRAVAAVVDHPLGRFWAVSVHLDAHSTQRHRHHQMRLVLDHLDTVSPSYPVLIGGDWNTSTYNSKRATYSILGYCRRVAMGVRHVIKNHYPYPERWFERRLFRELESRGYDYRNLNQLGACTLHYDVKDLALNRNMGDWIPKWCFWFINWALEQNTGNEGRCSLKLDWFAGREIRPAGDQKPLVVHDIRQKEHLSDHDPIILDFRPVEE
ncbi:MAG: endonuclease/exonuclease/phosphatase family protein [Acidobacteriota bacterium]